MVDLKLLLNPLVSTVSRGGGGSALNFLRQRKNNGSNSFNSLTLVCPNFNCPSNVCDDDDSDRDQQIPFGGDSGLIFQPSLKRRYILAALLMLLIILVIAVAYFTGVFSREHANSDRDLVPPNPMKNLPPSASTLHVFRRAAVCADGKACAEIGKNILEKNGSAADAAIATMFCNGVVNMQSMGLGGGFLMTIYKKDENKAYFLNAREKAPLKSEDLLYKDDPKKSQMGPLAIGVPGELRGYWALYKRFGSLPWKELIQPTIDLCENGYNMSDHQYNSLFRNKLVKKDPNFNEWFIDSEGNFKKSGSLVVPKKLSQTLQLIADNGGDDLYNGTLSKMFLEDLKEAGSHITAQDLAAYEAEWMEPITVKFYNEDRLFSAPPPGSGVLLGFMMNILDGYKFNRESMEDENVVLTYHRIIEAFKYAYAKRTELGDTDFVNIDSLLANLTSRSYADHIRAKIMDNTTFADPKHYGAVYYSGEDHGTAHISILAENGDAISVTSSVNIYFGAGLTSKQTGIIFNSVMDDFSFKYFKNYFNLPGSPNNAMAPGKRPLSSMSPSIITDKNGDVKMVVGASGGTKITTSIALTIMRSLWFGENIKEAVDAPRIHHQLYPMEIEYEYGTLQKIVDGLRNLGHKLKRNAGSIVCALLKQGNRITANADYRKGGEVYGLT